MRNTHYIAMLLSCSLLSSHSILSQSIKSTVNKFESYHQQSPIEKAYLHTDKETYVQGETLWFAAYLVDGTSHEPGGQSTLLYADLISPNDKILRTLSIKIEEGLGAGEFVLDDSLAGGTYTLRAYTNYMRNFDTDYFFSKPIQLLKFSSDSIFEDPSNSYSAIDFQLFPEGGQLIDGVVNNIAFKVTNEKGYGMDMVAKIVNQDDDELGQFATQHLGMGMFQFTPKTGEQYFAQYELNGTKKKVAFPASNPSGHQLTVRRSQNKTYVTVKATPGLGVEDCFVLAHIRGRIISMLQAKAGKDFIYHAFNNAELPSGIIHFTVFQSGHPYLERLTFIDNPTERPELTISLQNEELKKREKAVFDLDLQSQVGEMLNGNLSVSVLKMEDLANTVDIENFLLLTSDLKGTIEHPEYYTDRENPDRMKSLELLMLTHGWRRFAWDVVLSDSLPPITYYPEKGFTLEGQVVKYINRNKGTPAKVVLSFMEDMAYQQETQTAADGTFWFEGLQIEDTVTALVRTIEMNEKKRKKKTEGEEVRDQSTFITYTESETPYVESKLLASYGKKESYRKQLDTRLEIKQIDMSFGEQTIILNEIVVKAKWDAKTDPYYRRAFILDKHPPFRRIIVDSIVSEKKHYQTIFKLIPRLYVGFMVRGSYPHQYISPIGNDSKVPIYLDGWRIYDLNTITSEFVEVVELHMPLYGNMDYGFFVYYQTSMPPAPPHGLLVQQMIGYHQPTEFYIPKYDIMTDKEKVKPDYRSTQYWNPKVIVIDGKETFNYFTSDNRGDFVMYIEGITNEGMIVKEQLKFSVE